MMLRGVSQNSDTTFVKQNLKLVRHCGFRFSRHPTHYVEHFAERQEIDVFWPRFEKSRLLFGMFRGDSQKSETTILGQL